ncbi:hypothetical protein DOY81_014238, partial [Sarcophaga bullata]
ELLKNLNRIVFLLYRAAMCHNRPTNLCRCQGRPTYSTNQPLEPQKVPRGSATATLGGGGNHASEGGSSAGSAPVSGITEKDLRDITDEIRKLKAIIVKHENRIRALEAAVRAQEDDTDGVATRNANNNANSNDTKASDSNKKDTNDSSANNDNGTPATAASDDA